MYCTVEENLSVTHVFSKLFFSTGGDNFSPQMPCQWYVRGGGEGKRRILIGQSAPPTPFGMAFGRLKLSPLYGRACTLTFFPHRAVRGRELLWLVISP
jgi:hypothetical protein